MPLTVRQVLDDHERSLEKRLKELRDQIIPLERELMEVRRARGALTLSYYGPEQTQIDFAAPGEQTSVKASASSGKPQSPYLALTIKNLVRKALSEQFERGATANQLLEFFENAWGRGDIARTSLSPQLSRLKRDGQIVLRGQIWSLSSSREAADQPDGKAATDR
jgi:hypothetical protein